MTREENNMNANSTDDRANARGDSSSDEPLLSIDDLTVEFETQKGVVEAVTDVSLSIGDAETVGIVGESGSGKSVTAASILQLLDQNATVEGSIRFDDEELLEKTTEEMRNVRGNRISMIFQETGSSLNPVLTVGDQISETIRTHQDIPGEEIGRLEKTIAGNIFRSKDRFTKFEESWERTVELFDKVGIPLPERRALEYPHEYSGGMKQRAMIAMAISCQPDLLIADEPTTALDVTIEAQILDLVDELQREFGTSVLFITHDMGVVHEVCDRIAVMYAGRIVETAPTEDLFDHPKHPYTEALLDSVPSLEGGGAIDTLEGKVPDPTRKPPGCPFLPRCSKATTSCESRFPPAYPVTEDDDPLQVRPGTTETSGKIPDVRRAAGRSDGTNTDSADHEVHCVLYGEGSSLEMHPTVEDSNGTTGDGR